MSKGVLVVGGLVVVAGIVALFLLLGSSDDDKAAAQTPQGSAVAVTPPPMGNGMSAPTVTPTLPGEPRGALPAGDAEHPRDYVVGDTRIRDHRSGNNAPIDVPPNVHPAEGRQIPSLLTHEIAQKVKTVMKECVADVPADARGPKPRLEGQIKIAIKDHKATVTKAFMQMRDMTTDTVVETAKQCIEQKSVGIENPAADQADLEDYDIHLTFAIP